MGKRLQISGLAVGITAALLFCAGCQRQPQTSPAQGQARREAIYFLQGDATLSPGAIAKLKTWAETWGQNGRWILACPSGPGLPYELLEKRVQNLRAELRKHGLAKVETRLLPREPAGKYDAIYVMKEPF
jgi:hypothetical protein